MKYFFKNLHKCLEVPLTEFPAANVELVSTATKTNYVNSKEQGYERK